MHALSEAFGEDFEKTVPGLPQTVKNLPVIEPGHHWWLDIDYRQGVSKRVGWWTVSGKYRFHWYVVVFRDGTRTAIRPGVEHREIQEL